MTIYIDIDILSSAVVYFSDSLPSKSPILIIMYHLEPMPESYKFIKSILDVPQINKPVKIWANIRKNQNLLRTIDHLIITFYLHQQN